MKSLKVIATLAVAGIGTFGVASFVHAEDGCSTGAVKGTYAVSCTGAAAPFDNPAAGLLPASGLGNASFDGSGGVLGGQLDVSIGGFHLTQVITGGIGQVHPDCTSSVELDVTVGGIPLPPLTMSGHVLDRGDRILAFSKVPGTSALCTLERVSRRTGADSRPGDGDDDDDDDDD